MARRAPIHVKDHACACRMRIFRATLTQVRSFAEQAQPKMALPHLHLREGPLRDRVTFVIPFDLPECHSTPFAAGRVACGKRHKAAPGFETPLISSPSSHGVTWR